MNKSLYKVLPAAEWRAAEAAGCFRGWGIDLQDGYIHLSSADQVVETVARHFADQDGLLLVTVSGDKLGSALRWEPSRGGELFPHVYGVIPIDAVEKVEPLPHGDGGTHQFPFGN